MPEPLVPREELRATLDARRELGKEFEPELLDAFVEKLEKRLEARKPDTSPARGMSSALAMVSLGTGIPMTAIAVANGGLLALAIVWLGIVLVNVAFSRGR